MNLIDSFGSSSNGSYELTLRYGGQVNSENMSMSASFMSDVEKMSDVLSSRTRDMEEDVTSHIFTLPLACLQGVAATRERERERERETHTHRARE